MINLPVSSNNAQANHKSVAPNNNVQTNTKVTDPDKPTPNANNQESQPFGKVLARQISDKTSDSKNSDAVVTDGMIAAAPDTKPGDASNANMTTPLPGDLLATLSQQSAVAAVVAQMNIPAQSATVKAPQPSESRQFKAPIRAMEITAGGRTDPVVQDTKLTVEPDKGNSFVNVLTGVTDTAAAKRLEPSVQHESAISQSISQPAIPTAAALQSMTNLNPAAVQDAQLLISTPVSQDRWGDEFCQKITWLASSNQDQSAELHLNPPQLGPLDVVLKISGDQATALFTSSHAAVREAIEQSIPKLREMLADNGIMLGNTSVSDQAPRDQGGDFSSPHQAASSGRVLEVTPSNVSSPRATTIVRHNGGVDTFA